MRPEDSVVVVTGGLGNRAPRRLQTALEGARACGGYRGRQSETMVRQITDAGGGR